jgi:hypothetical protein
MPKNAAALSLALLLTTALAARDDDPEPKARAVKPREIPATGLPAGRGSYDAPISIPSEKHLAELVPDRDARAAILKQVDFKKERLLLFSWSGSGGDGVTPALGKAGEANFHYAGGKTSDLVRHARLFAIPARAKVKVTAR